MFCRHSDGFARILGATITIRTVRFCPLQSPEPSGIIDLRSFHVAEGNYTKRKHVFKLVSLPHAAVPLHQPHAHQHHQLQHQQHQQHHQLQHTQQPHAQQPYGPPSPTVATSGGHVVAAGTELLIQTDGPQSMRQWMEQLQRAADTRDSAVSLGRI